MLVQRWRHEDDGFVANKRLQRVEELLTTTHSDFELFQPMGQTLDGLCHFSLPTDANQRLIGLAQLREMGQQVVDLVTPGLGFQHVLANEQIETLDILNGDRLIEHIHRFAPPRCHGGDPGGILRVLGGYLEATSGKFGFDAIGFIEASQVLFNRARFFREKIEFLDRSIGLEVEKLSQSEG